jgi:hypothetical protein
MKELLCLELLKTGITDSTDRVLLTGPDTFSPYSQGQTLTDGTDTFRLALLAGTHALRLAIDVFDLKRPFDILQCIEWIKWHCLHACG